MVSANSLFDWSVDIPAPFMAAENFVKALDSSPTFIPASLATLRKTAIWLDAIPASP